MSPPTLPELMKVTEALGENRTELLRDFLTLAEASKKRVTTKETTEFINGVNEDLIGFDLEGNL